MEDYCNGTNSTTTCESSIYQKVAGSFVFVIIWPLIVLDFKKFPIGRPAAALLGAVLMVVFHVINQPGVYRTEGEQSNLQTIFLLIGMMILSYYFDREGLLTIISLKIFGKTLTLRKVLWRVCVLTAALSAFVTNDAACLLIAPLILNIYVKYIRDPRELLPLTLGIATSANIGSAATIFGNPQNVLISAKANVTLIDFFIAELPTSVIALMINIGLLHLIFFRVLFRSRMDNEHEPILDSEILEGTPSSSIDESRSARAISLDQSTNPHQTSQIAEEREKLIGQHIEESTLNTVRQVPRAYRSLASRMRSPEQSMVHSARDREGELTKSVNNIAPLEERKSSEKVFVGWLIFVSILLVVLLAISVPQLKEYGVYFNLGLTTAAAAVFTMLVDSIVNRKHQRDSMMKVDWTVILMFLGLFVWIEGFSHTCIPEAVFEFLRPFMNLKTVEGVVIFTVFIVLGSNIFSNVPLVILMVDHLNEFCGKDDECDPSFKIGSLLLAWISTIAGNFTLFGSIANLIVAEKAKTSKADYDFSFWRYLPYGLISTVVITIITVPIVYGLGLVASKIK